MFERREPSLNKDLLQVIPYSCTIGTGRYSVNVHTGNRFLHTDLLRPDNGYASSIPGWNVSENHSQSPQSIVVVENEISSIHYNYAEKMLLVLGNPDNFQDGQAVAWLSYWLLETQRQADSVFTMHSSAFNVGNNGVLLLGHSGAGKTSIMLDYCRRYNGGIISNDLTLVSHDRDSQKMVLKDGTKEIRLRRTTVQRNFPDLEALFPERRISPWEDKIIATPEDLGITSTNPPKPIRAIFDVHLDSEERDGLNTESVDDIGTRYRLYEDLSRIVRASAISVFGSSNEFLGFIPPLDTEELHNNRVACIECMISNIGVISLSGGNLREVTDAMKDVVDKLN